MGNLLPILPNPLRSIAPDDQLHIRADEDSGIVWLCKGDMYEETEDGIERIGTLTLDTRIVGQDGDIMAVDVAGRATVNINGTVATRPRSSAIPRAAWQMLIDGSVNDTPTDGVSPQLTLPLLLADFAADAAALENPDGYECGLFMFGGTVTDGNQFNYKVHRAYQIQIGTAVTWLSTEAAAGIVTFGDEPYTAGGAALGATGNLLADTITETMASQGVNVISGAANNPAMLCVEYVGATALIVEVDRTTAATIDVWAAPSDAPRLVAVST